MMDSFLSYGDMWRLLDQCQRRNRKLEDERQKLQEALGKYADENNWRCLKCERSEDSTHKYEHDQDAWEHASNGPDIAKAALADKGEPPTDPSIGP